MLADVERCIFELKRDREAQSEWRAGSRVGATGLRLSAEEERALLDVDLETLWRMGVHPLLLMQFARMAGVPVPNYYATIRSTGVHTDLRS
jgi:hypothetical protein